MKKLFLKLFLALLPILFVLAVYIYRDPYKVLYHYDSYYQTDGISYITLCNDYVSTENFINKSKDHQYDSYIFGNSRSIYYHTDQWQKHINAHGCYHFDAQLETLWGIERKFQFLHDRGIKIKNALIVMDQSVLRNKREEQLLYFTIKHPLISGKNRISFQLHFLKTFLDKNFLMGYIPYLFTHDPKDKNVFFAEDAHYDPITNEKSFPRDEELILRNRDSFYTPRLYLFYKRDSIQKYSTPVIKQEQLDLLANIKKIMDEDKTEYRIVINPLYDQVKLDTTDLQVLYTMFGKNKVFDFSGKNEITQSMYNYYENSHYRPFIANNIMDSIYAVR